MPESSLPTRSSSVVLAATLLGLVASPCLWSEVKISVAFDKDAGAREMAGGATGPLLQAVWAKVPPKIDGKLNDACWSVAPATGGFMHLDSGKLVEAQTEMRFVVDDQNLYVAFRCEEPEIATVKTHYDNRDEAVWRDDSVEVFLDPSQLGRTVYHLIMSAKSVVYDEKVALWEEEDPGAAEPGTMIARRKPDSSWNGDFDVATHHGEDFWSLEAKIPAEQVTPFREIVRGATWGFKVSRTKVKRGKPRDAIIYSSPFGGQAAWLDTTTYARLKLGESPVLLEVAPGNLAKGQNEALLTFSNKTEAALEGYARLVLQGPSGARPAEQKLALRAGTKAVSRFTYELDTPGNWTVVAQFTDQRKKTVLAAKVYETEVSEQTLTLQLPKQEFLEGEEQASGKFQIRLGDVSLQDSFLDISVKDGTGACVAGPTRAVISSSVGQFSIPLASLRDGLYRVEAEVLPNRKAARLGHTSLSFSVQTGPHGRPRTVIHAFDFGPAGQQVMDGFREAKCNGLLRYVDAVPDPLCMDGLLGGKHLVKLPNGRYRVGLWSGACGRNLLMNRDHGEARIAVNGQVLLADEAWRDSYERAIFLGDATDLTPAKKDLYSALVEPYYEFTEATVEVTQGHLDVTVSGSTRLNALVVAPEDKKLAFESFVTHANASRRKIVETAWLKGSWSPSTPPPHGRSHEELGYVPFIPEPGETVDLQTMPTLEQQSRDLELFAAPGEWEPASIGIWPLADAGSLSVKVGDLRNDNEVLPAARVRIKRVQYGVRPGPRFFPFYLKDADAVTLEKGVPREFQLWFQVPDSARPGTYVGEVVLASERGATRLPVRVRVVDVDLPDVTRKEAGAPQFTMPYYSCAWYANSRDEEFQKKEVEYYKRDLRFMKERGLSPSASFGMSPWEYRKLMLEAGIDVPLSLYSCQQAPGLTLNWKSMKCRFEEQTKTEAGTEAFQKKLVEGWDKGVEQIEAAGFSTDDFQFSLMDEVGSHLGRKGVDREMAILRAMKEYGKVRTFIEANHPLELEVAPYVDLFLFNNSFRIDQEVIDRVKATGTAYGLYNTGMKRVMFGFYTWRVEARKVWQWHYYRPEKTAVSGFLAVNYATQPGPEGPYPTIRLEKVREGIDDYRYLMALENLVAKGSASTSSEVKEAVAHAEAVRRFVYERVDPNLSALYRAGTMTHRAMNLLRWRIAESAEKLKRALGKEAP